MPVSDLGSVFPIMQEVVSLRPKRILDLGIGFGKYGALCRETLEAVHGRCKVADFQVVMNGVEGFLAYKNPLWKLYDNIYVEDIRDNYTSERYSGYDIVLAVDVIEHIEKKEAFKILSHLVANNKYVIVSVPLGNCPQGTVFGNELETHRTRFDSWADFLQVPDGGVPLLPFGTQVISLHKGVCGVVRLHKLNTENK